MGLYSDGRFYEYTLQTGRMLSSLLVPSIDRVVSAAGLKLADIDYFACGLGPGSFTGMRIGLATVKGLCAALNKPVAGICTLDIMAAAVPAGDAMVVPAVDAKRGLIYCAFYKNSRGIKRQGKYSLLSLDDFVKKFSGRAVIFGDAVDLYKDKMISRIKGVSILEKDYWFPRARNLIELALPMIASGKVSKAEEIKPIYLYPQECQIKRR
jgi:tRNA threonylcarbamoyladenosine biosynthesis protein TsaB